MGKTYASGPRWTLLTLLAYTGAVLGHRWYEPDETSLRLPFGTAPNGTRRTKVVLRATPLRRVVKALDKTCYGGFT